MFSVNFVSETAQVELKSGPESAPAWNASRGRCSMGITLMPEARGLHSFTSELNLSALYGIGGACRCCVAHVKGVLEGG